MQTHGEDAICQEDSCERFKRLPKGPHGGIQLLLIQSVDHLGKQGDVVEVKPGYANNYLLPQGLATLASDHHQRMVEKHRAQLIEIENARLADLRVLADALTKQSVTIEANANDEGHLYGSVGAAEIVAALKQNEFQLTTDQIRLEGPLKELGLYTVKIHLHREIQADLKVWVVPTAAADAATARLRPRPGSSPRTSTVARSARRRLRAMPLAGVRRAVDFHGGAGHGQVRLRVPRSSTASRPLIWMRNAACWAVSCCCPKSATKSR